MAASAAAAVGFLAGSRCGCCFLPRPPPAREGEWRRVEETLYRERRERRGEGV